MTLIGFLAAANLFACATSPADPLVVEGEQPVTNTEVLDETAPAQEAAPTPTEPTPASVPAANLPIEARFAQWKQGFIARMSQRYDPATVERLIAPAQLRPELFEQDANQAEFVKPVWSYLDTAIADTRVRPGRENLQLFSTTFDEVEARYRVPREILTAVWGLESQYGTIMGDYPVVDTLSSFAFEGRRSEMFTNQLEALVGLVASGMLREDQLLGGWAGAMGMTQFMPATLRDYAVDFDGNGVIELRSSEADALGSAAHYLSRFGWVPGQPAYVEVQVPTGFDYALADGSTKRSVAEWAQLGVAPVSGSFDPAIGASEAKLVLLAGARGPAFLTLKNFDVIKRYNNSTSYALAVAGLAKTFDGEIPVVRDWPRDDQPLGRSDIELMQEALTRQGYDTRGVDGVVGPATRRAIRAWQAANGLPADGYVEQTLLQRILAG